MTAQTDTPPDVQYRRILFCTDFSINADHAFHYALASARRSAHAQLHILHVLPEPDAQFWRTYLYEIDDVDAKASADMNQKINETYLQYVSGETEVIVAVEKGKAEQTILDYARRIRAELIVMGRHGPRPVGMHLFGNVSEKVACKAACPVLLVPHP